MSTDQPVTLTVWYDAKTNPPPEDNVDELFTDQGWAWHMDGKWWGDDGTLAPQPSAYCDPIPPGDDLFTVADLRLLTDFVYGYEPAEDWAAVRDAAIRVNRALNALEDG